MIKLETQSPKYPVGIHPNFAFDKVKYQFHQLYFTISIVSIPPIRFNNVDLPEPEGPSMTHISPLSIVPLTPFNT